MLGTAALILSNSILMPSTNIPILMLRTTILMLRQLALWGRQSCLRARFPACPAGWKGGCSQDWLPHKAPLSPLCICVYFLLLSSASAVIIDRIAVIVNTHAIKDTDIQRDIRLTDFLNGDPFSPSEPERKKAAQRLIDQQIIHREVELGNYSQATPTELNNFLSSIQKQRFGGAVAYGEALSTYKLTDEEVRTQLNWQITVLHFIEQRFRPAVIVSDEEIAKYAKTHPQPRDQIQETLIGMRVNDAFESWINNARKRAQIEYREAGLQ